MPTLRSTPDEHGSVSIEFVLLAPVLLVLMLFVVYLGRATQANARVHHAADQAARAASLVSSAHAGSAAQAMAQRELTAGGVRCDSLSVSSSRTTSAGLQSVSVTVRCTVPRDQLAPLAPGSRLVQATSTEVIDLIRAKD